MNRTRTVAGLCRGAVLAAWIFAASPAWAQLPTTELDWLFPPGGKAGSSFVVRVAGANQDELVSLDFSHPGLKAEPQKRARGEFDRQETIEPGVFQVVIAEDVPPGAYEARVRGRFGTSNPRAFVVGTETEWVDDGSNKSAEKAREITVGTVANGYVDARGIDYYELVMKQGQRVLIECFAERIDSRMDPTVLVLDGAGRELARGVRYRGRDPLIDFTAPADADYTIAVFDAVFAGGNAYYYRLRVHDGPHVDFVFPPMVPAGQKATVTVFGRNLSDSQPSSCRLGTVALEQTTAEIDAGESAAAGPRTTSLVHTSVDAFWKRVNDCTVRIGIAEAPVALEAPDNDSPDRAQKIDVPVDFAGQFYPRADEDWVEFSATKGQVFYIDVVSHRLGIPCDPFLLVQKITVDAQGAEKVAELAQVDEPGDRNNRIGSNFDTSTDDPTYRLACDEDARYRLMVRDNFGNSRPDPRKVYRLVIRPARPDFHLVAAPEQIKVANNNQVLMFSMALNRGGGVPLRVLIDRHDGFNGEIKISAQGLPDDIRCRPVVAGSAATEAWLVLTASADAAPWHGPVQIVGEAQLDGESVTRTAAAGSVVWGTGNRQQQVPEFRETGDLVVSLCEKVSDPALVELGGEPVIETSLGAKLEIPVKVTRQDGYKEALKFAAIGLPNELKPKDLTINGDQSEGVLSLEVTNGRLKPDTYTFILRTDTKVNTARNPDELAEAEEDVRSIGELIGQLDEQIKQATAARDETVKRSQEMAEASKQSVAAREAASKKLEQASAASAEGRKQLEAARAAAEKDPANEELANTAAEAARQAEQLAAAEASAKAESDEATKAAEGRQADAAKAEAEKNEAEADLKQLQDKRGRADAHQKSVTKRRDDSKKANAAKDVNIALVSTPISIRVHATPIAITAENLAIEPGKKVELPITLERRFGFAEAVEVSVEFPKDVKGLSAAKATISKEAGTAPVEVSAAEDAAESTVTVTLRAKAKYNNVDVEATEVVEIRVARPMADSQAPIN